MRRSCLGTVSKTQSCTAQVMPQLMSVRGLVGGLKNTLVGAGPISLAVCGFLWRKSLTGKTIPRLCPGLAFGTQLCLRLCVLYCSSLGKTNRSLYVLYVV